ECFRRDLETGVHQGPQVEVFVAVEAEDPAPDPKASDSPLDVAAQSAGDRMLQRVDSAARGIVIATDLSIDAPADICGGIAAGGPARAPSSHPGPALKSVSRDLIPFEEPEHSLIPLLGLQVPARMVREGEERRLSDAVHHATVASVIVERCDAKPSA